MCESVPLFNLSNPPPSPAEFPQADRNQFVRRRQQSPGC